MPASTKRLLRTEPHGGGRSEPRPSAEGAQSLPRRSLDEAFVGANQAAAPWRRRAEDVEEGKKESEKAAGCEQAAVDTEGDTGGRGVASSSLSG